eukprot:609806-Alexandrium_andersonii.AAC.1
MGRLSAPVRHRPTSSAGPIARYAMVARVFPADGWRAAPRSIGLPANPGLHVFRVLSHDAKSRELQG